ncbi:hypothetical protein M595_0235 [Lyngbya aestuarii BL J]|uniref:Uncharacterized protein n=1 Tax=Lyngbya aestuarii BL J TaxID=1348334 RepID=U7QPQ5_9CYAN|nr:hypothetical protein M595_0235 [Lyngbya aestuarii BL J]
MINILAATEKTEQDFKIKLSIRCDRNSIKPLCLLIAQISEGQPEHVSDRLSYDQLISICQVLQFIENSQIITPSKTLQS